MDAIAGHGTCPTCGRDKINGPNGVFCPPCALKRNIDNPKITNNHIPYPTKKQFELAIGKVDKNIQESDVPTAIPATQQPAPVLGTHIRLDGSPFQQCVDILKTVPVLEDPKLYAKLRKLITMLKELESA
jgi:hypothetical protein